MKKEVGDEMKFDCIVIGGGPSGLMASIGAAEQGAKVLLIDKGPNIYNRKCPILEKKINR